MAEIRESIVLEVKAEGAQQSAQQLTISFDKLVGSLERIERNLEASSQALRELVNAEKKLGDEVKETTEKVEKQDDAVNRAGNTANRSAREFNTFASVFRRTADQAQSAVGPLTRIASLFAGGLGVQAVSDSLASFDRGLSQVQAISRATVPELERIKQVSLDLGAQTSRTASEALQGAVELARAGFSAIEVPQALPATLALSVTAGVDLARASEIASNAIRQFGLAADDTVRVTDALTVVANNASTDVQQLADALGFAGPLAASFGLDIEQTAAALGAISDGGIKASRAGTGLAGILRRLVDPSKEARQEFERIGIAIEELDPRTNDFANVVDRLGESYRRGADFTRIFDAEQIAAAIVIARLEERYDSLLTKQRDSVDAAGEQANAFGRDLQGAFDRFGSTLESITLKAGDQGLGLALKNVTEFGIETLQVLGGLDDSSREVSDGAQLAASAIEGVGVALGALLALSGGAALIASLANPFVAAAAAVGVLVTAVRTASRELKDLEQSSVDVSNSIETAIKNSAEFAAELEKLSRIGGLRFEAQTSQDTERFLTTLINRTVQLADETRRLAADPSARLIVNSFSDLNKQIQEAEDNVNSLERQLSGLLDIGPPREEFGGELDLFVRQTTKLRKEIVDAKAELDILVGSARQSRGITFIPIGEDIRLIAEQAGLLDQLAEAEKRATEGATTLEDRVSLLTTAQERLSASLDQVNGKSREAAKAAGEAADATNRQAEAARELADQQARQQFDASIAGLRQQIELIESRTKALRDAGAEQGRFLDVLREQEAEDATRTLALQEIARLEAQSVSITEERTQAIFEQAAAIVAAQSGQEDLIRALQDEFREREKLARAAGRDVSAGERDFSAEQAARRAAQAQEQAESIARALQLEALSYSRTREEVERLRLEEQLRGLEVSQNLKDEIRLIQQQTEEIRASREAAAAIGSSLAGGVGDALRTLRDSGSGADALVAGLQGISDRIFSQSVAQIEQALTSAFTDAFAAPTAGEALIVAAVGRVEAAVRSSAAFGGVGGVGVEGVGEAAAGGLYGPPAPSGLVAAGGGGVVAGAQAGGFVGPPMTAASGGLYGPPVPEGFQFAGQQTPTFWNTFSSNLGTAFAGAAVSFAFGMIASRMGGGGESARGPGFGVLGLEDRERATYNDNRRVTNVISQTPRTVQQTYRQEAEQRFRRF